MIQDALLSTLIPIRDARDRTIAYELRTHPLPGRAAVSIDDEARAVLVMLQRRELLRMVRGKPLHVPITPALLRAGAVTGFASANVVFLLAVTALEHEETRRAIERYVAAGFRFGFVGSALSAPLPEALRGATVAIDAGALNGLALSNALQRLLEYGAKPIARQVNDRATRERLRANGVEAFTGRPLPRGRAEVESTVPRILRALRLLASLADGRPPDATLDAFVASDPVIADSVFRATASAATGATRPRTLSHAFTLLGREAMLERLRVATAVLVGESSGDEELGAIAIRRSRTLEQLAAAVDRVGHPRACALAGLLSVTDVATGLPPAVLADELDLSSALRDVLVARESPLGILVDIVEAHEAGWWDDLFTRCHELGISPVVVGAAWADSWHVARTEISARAVSES